MLTLYTFQGFTYIMLGLMVIFISYIVGNFHCNYGSYWSFEKTTIAGFKMLLNLMSIIITIALILGLFFWGMGA